jgi:hypothetical protein
MTQLQLDRAVARVTGETVDTIQARGFIYVSSPRRRRHRRTRRCHDRTGPSHPSVPLSVRKKSPGNM